MSGRAAAPSARAAGPDRRPARPAAWTRRQTAETNLRALGGRAYPRVSGLTREPSWLLFEMVLPFLTTSAFVLVYRALQAPAGVRRLRGPRRRHDRLLAQRHLDDGGQLYWEKGQGNLELYFTAPMDLMAVLLRHGRRRHAR